MRTRAGLDEAVTAIQGKVSLHTLVGTEANFVDTDLHGTLTGEARKNRAQSFLLLFRPDRDAVDD